MENNIFENAKFGDKFKTRDGRMAVYWSYNKIWDGHVLILESQTKTDCPMIVCDDNGKCKLNNNESESDIVFRWEETIDEHELLIKLSEAQADYLPVEKGCNSSLDAIKRTSFGEGYEMGYRAAKSENKNKF